MRAGLVVDFEIQEGKGDLRAHRVALGKKWADEVFRQPVMVFDREGAEARSLSSMTSTTVSLWRKRHSPLTRNQIGTM
jgi:hypothetical protein